MVSPSEVANSVRKYTRGLPPISLEIQSLKVVPRANAGRGFAAILAIRVEQTDQVFVSETPVSIDQHEITKLTGKIVGYDRESSLVFVAIRLNRELSDLSVLRPDGGIRTLKIDNADILLRLAEQIQALPSIPEMFSAAVEGISTGDLVADEDSLLVAEELSNLRFPWARFLWGPPGAGKTFALGRLCYQLLASSREERILLVAPSNRAVDVALQQMVTQLDASPLRSLVAERRILRFGYPKRPEILQRKELLGDSRVDTISETVRRTASELAKAERSNAREEVLADLRTTLLVAQEEVKDAVANHFQNLSIVATTTTLACSKSSPIGQCEWSTVMVDEVTMVTPAACLFLSSLAKKRLLLAGDPQQLGPVFIDSRYAGKMETEWLGLDIFEKSGVSRRVENKRTIANNDSRLVRITSQRRCATDIWLAVDHLYPEVANRSDAHAISAFTALPPGSGKAVVVLDTSRARCSCEKQGGSWRNQRSAELALEVANTLAAEGQEGMSVAIVSPYAAQVALLRRLIRSQRDAKHLPQNYGRIDCGTVHQFQGSDADVVVFDLVDGQGRDRLGILLRGEPGTRLVNVAVTRARGKVVVLAEQASSAEFVGEFWLGEGSKCVV